MPPPEPRNKIYLYSAPKNGIIKSTYSPTPMSWMYISSSYGANIDAETQRKKATNQSRHGLRAESAEVKKKFCVVRYRNAQLSVSL